jgi:hypothetical protein
MKTKIFLTLCSAFVFSFLSAQVPVGFNYQAIARDGSGNILANQPLPVKIDIQTSLTGGTLIYEELFPLVTSNQFGLINLVVGTGTSTGMGSVSSFSMIDWKAQPLFLKTIVQYPGTTWTTMGTSQIFSVPYSLVAKDVQGPLSKLGITGTTDNMEEALFEVRNKAGNTVFAVYNEGVRAYVGNGDAKGIRGGFAVGGYDDTKGVHDLMWVTSDSVRVYIDNVPGNKGIRGGFAVGGYDMSKGGVMSKYLNIETESLATVDPAQNRILWYPLKNAFMTGKILIQKGDTVGENSFASGYESKAIGDYSQALGYQAIARGLGATSIGINSETKGAYSLALGWQAKSTGMASYAMGNQAKATGMLSYVLGTEATATGTGSYAIGTQATAIGNQSIALGSVGVDSLNKATGKTIASGYGSIAIGFGSNSSGQGALTAGVEDTASADFSSAIGYRSASKGWGSVALGYGSKAKGIGSVATGWGCVTDPQYWWAWGAMANNMVTKATNFAATSFGDRTTASGHTSFATGYRTKASGHLSATFGDETVASADLALAIGQGTTAQSYSSLVLGRFNSISGTKTSWISSEPAIVVGNGTDTLHRSNAVTIYKNGDGIFTGALNLNYGKTGILLYANGSEALWFGNNGSGNCYSWGYGGTYNVFANKVAVGTTGYPGSYYLYVVGNAYTTGTWGGSDARWKKNISDLGTVLNNLELLTPVSYNWRKDEFPDMHFDDSRQIGLVAQEVEKVFPDLVRTDDKGYKAVAYDKLSVVLLQGLKEQEQQIKSQQEQIDMLRKQVDELLSRSGK